MSVEIRNPGDEGNDDHFTVVIRTEGAEETFENVSLSHARTARNVVETINRESRLVRVAERHGLNEFVLKAEALARDAAVVSRAPAASDRPPTPRSLTIAREIAAMRVAAGLPD